MKKTKKLLLTFTALACGGLLFGCGILGGGTTSSGSSSQGGESSVQEESSSSFQGTITPNDSGKIEVVDSANAQAKKYVIEGAQDIHIAQSVKEISSYTAKVQAVCEGKGEPVIVDDSAVKYGVQGEYDLVYSYQDLSEKVKVIVYGAPTITLAANARTEYAYSEYYEGVTDGLTAKDCFGGELDVRLHDDKGAANADGSLNAGTYEMTFAAVDTAGQIVYVDKSVTIQAPTISAIEESYGYDVADENLVIQLNEGDVDGFLALSLDGTVLPASAVIKETDKLIIDGDYLYSTRKKDESVPLRLLTVNGYADSSFTLTDKGIVAYDDVEMQTYVQSAYECLVAQELPAIALTNQKQTVAPVYTLKKGEQVVSTGRAVTFEEDGTYTLEVTLREGQVLTYSITTFFNLGFISGTAYSDSEGMNGSVSEGYTLKGYTVYNHKGESVLTYSVGGDFATFNGAFKALSKKQAYTMKIDALIAATGREVSQKVDFSVIGANTTALLTDSLDGGEKNISPVKSDVTELKYVATSLGGRVGAYKWTANKEGATTSTMLTFNSKFSSVLKEGAYLSFDIYAEKEISLTWFGKTQHYLYNDVSGLTSAKFYNEDGVQFSGGSLWGGSFKGQWVTVEIVLDEDFNFESIWRGLSITSKGLYGNNVYLANVKVSTESIYSENTQVPDTPDTPDVPDTPDTPDVPDTPVTGTEATILADESDLTKGNVYANKPDVVSLTYVETEVGGKTGVFKWSTTSTTGSNSNTAMLRFKDTFSEPLKKGSYVSFDIYTDTSISLSWFGKETQYIYNMHSESNAAVVRVFDADGQLITNKKIWGSTALLNQWITFEICLDEDYNFASEYRGLSMWSSGFTNTANVYLDNIKVSASAKVATTPTLPTDGTILANEIDLINGYVSAYNEGKTSLTYEVLGIGGRGGVFKWSTTSETAVNGPDSTLKFSSLFSDQLKKGAYVRFDIYVTAPVTLAWSGKDTTYLYNNVATTPNTTFYDENGEVLTAGSIWGGSFNGRWITVEICLDEDYNFESEYRGLYVYGNGFTVSNPLYIDNIEVSNEPMNN